MKKEEFKEFVRNNPKLINHVKTGEMTWQGFYEMYDMYGADSNVWDEYIKEEKKILLKYNMTNLEEYKAIFGNALDTERTFYQTFLIQTDHRLFQHDILHYRLMSSLQ